MYPMQILKDGRYSPLAIPWQSIQFYHLADSLLLSLNPAHTISFNVPHLKDCSCSPITPFITSSTLSPVQWLV